MRTTVGLLLLVLSACAGTDDPGVTALDVTSSVALDATGIGKAPLTSLPTTRLHGAAFGDDAVHGKLIGTSEAFDAGEQIGARTIRRSASWMVQKDDYNGRILAVRNTPSAGPPTSLNDAQLAAQVRSRLNDWGIGGGEMGDVAIRRAMAQDLDGDTPEAPRVHGIKGFVMRQLNGVRVQGHRAVVTYTPDGQLQRVLVHWPPLAAQGHKLRTALPKGQIVMRARAALQARGINSGNGRIDWAYEPALDANGEVTLTLKAMVELPSRKLSDGSDEEPRILAVDVDATP